MVCPRCDGQGEVKKVHIQNISQYIYLCDECEASWEDGNDISIDNFIDFTTYLESKNVSYNDVVILYE